MHHDAQIIRSCEYYKNSSIAIAVYFVGCQQIIQYSPPFNLHDDKADGPNKVWACSSVRALSDVVSAKKKSSL